MSTTISMERRPLERYAHLVVDVIEEIAPNRYRVRLQEEVRRTGLLALADRVLGRRPALRIRWVEGLTTRPSTWHDLQSRLRLPRSLELELLRVVSIAQFRHRREHRAISTPAILGRAS